MKKINFSLPAPEPVSSAYLKALMAHFHLSVIDVSNLIHVHPITPYRWLSGKRAMPWALAELLRSEALKHQSIAAHKP